MKSKWSNQELLDALPEFVELYVNRPIKNNSGGMKSPHMFPAWFIVRSLKPKFLIESGVWKGLGTWFFRQASPNTHIISIDPEPRFRELTIPGVDYLTTDFLDGQWTLPSDDVLVFFDDHQDCMPRIKRCRELGFKRLVFEDNYPWQQGDCVSPKKVLSGRGYVIDKGGVRTTYANNLRDVEFLDNYLKIYQEMPPIFKDERTRWGDKWNDEYPTPEPLLVFPKNQTIQDITYEYYDSSGLFDERFDYTWLCYMELK